MELVTHSNWNTVIGQERVKNVLRAAIQHHRLAHAYLFWGNEGVGADALAIEFARTLLCIRQQSEACRECSSCKKVDALYHPNLKLIFPLPGGDSESNDDESPEADLVEEIRRQTAEKARNPYFHIEIPKAKFIRIKSIREIKREASLSSTEAGKKIFIIFDADTMSDAAANSLLKILEEPLEDVHFILTSSRKDAIKPTIISRCQLIQCSLLTKEDIANALITRERVDAFRATLIANLAGGSYTQALELLNNDLQTYRDTVVSFLRAALSAYPSKIFDDHDEYISGNRRAEAEQLLRMLHVWMRDALVLREGSALVFNIDQEQDLTSFVGKFSQKNLEACIAAVEHALELLRRNVYLPLVMLSLTVHLRRILNGK